MGKNCPPELMNPDVLPLLSLRFPCSLRLGKLLSSLYKAVESLIFKLLPGMDMPFFTRLSSITNSKKNEPQIGLGTHARHAQNRTRQLFFSPLQSTRYELTLFLVFEKEALKVSRQSTRIQSGKGRGGFGVSVLLKQRGSPRNHKKKPWTIQFRVPNRNKAFKSFPCEICKVFFHNIV